MMEKDYPIGRSLQQVLTHYESLLDKLDDPNYGRPIEKLDAEIEKMIRYRRIERTPKTPYLRRFG